MRIKLKNAIEEFIKDPDNPQLNNHPLKREWTGFQSINITADFRAIYKVVDFSDGESVYYFVALGTHEQLYKR